jgi:EAL domain-containing protein (putative c-di-GMP-specific phosphodiesterase class I)
MIKIKNDDIDKTLNNFIELNKTYSLDDFNTNFKIFKALNQINFEVLTTTIKDLKDILN